METYKSDPTRMVLENLSVLRHFPKQVLVLKGTKAVAALDARAPGIANRMIWRNADVEFARTVQALDQAEQGDPRVLRQILEHGRIAEEHLSKIEIGVPDILAALPDMQTMFTDDEVRRLRTDSAFTAPMRAKILGGASQICDALFQAYPAKIRRPTVNSRVNTFFYRYSLATLLYFLRWVRTGSQQSKRHDRVRNDFIDLTFATFGTYFNGLMSGDERARETHLELRNVLTMLGARVPEDYVVGFLNQLSEAE